MSKSLSLSLGHLAAALALGCTAELGSGIGTDSSAQGPTGGGATPSVGDEPAGDGDGTVGDGDGTVGDGDGTVGDGDRTEAQAQPQPQLYLLTYAELRNSLASLATTAALDPSEVQPDRSVAGFASAGAGLHSLSSLGVDRWETAVDSRLGQLFGDQVARAEFVGCEPSAADDVCANGFLTRLGGEAFRRPLSEDEIAQYRQVATDTSALFDGDPWEGLRYAAQTILQSPKFLNRVQLGEPDPAVPGKMRLTSYELAAKLAYGLTQAPPDAVLLQAAENGELETPTGLEDQVRRLVDSPEGREALTLFCRDLFSLSPLSSATRTEEVISELPASLLEEMEAETIAFCLSGLSGSDARKTFLAEQTTLGPELAALYGVQAPTDPSGAAPLPDPSRAGVLTSAGFLTVLAHQDRTSPTLRGRFVRERLLCQEVPDPPPTAVTELPEPPVGQTMTIRQRLGQHAEDPACAGCHQMMDPIGFALEHFDAVGRFRETEYGLAIDASGELDEFSYNGALELSDAITLHPRLPLCLATQWFRFSEARIEAAADQSQLAALGDDLVLSGFNFPSLIVKRALSNDFRSLTTEEVQ